VKPKEIAACENNKRYIVIDASNVAMTYKNYFFEAWIISKTFHSQNIFLNIKRHGHDGVFSSVGIKLVVDYFKNKGHDDIKAFVPRFRENHENTKNPEILNELEKERILVFTPSRSYDDGFILEAAKLKNAVIVSNDNYRDKIFEEEYREITEKKQVYLEMIFLIDAYKPKQFIYIFTIFILVLWHTQFSMTVR